MQFLLFLNSGQARQGSQISCDHFQQWGSKNIKYTKRKKTNSGKAVRQKLRMKLKKIESSERWGGKGNGEEGRRKGCQQKDNRVCLAKYVLELTEIRYWTDQENKTQTQGKEEKDGATKWTITLVSVFFSFLSLALAFSLSLCALLVSSQKVEEV